MLAQDQVSNKKGMEIIMIEQSKLMECMEEIKNIAATQQNHLTKEEIDKYLGDIELDARQRQAVYQYLAASRIKIEGFEYIPEPESVPAEKNSMEKSRRTREAVGKAAGGQRKQISGEGMNSGKAEKAQRNLAMYKREVALLQEISDERIEQLFSRFLSGEDALREKMIHCQLQKVIDRAEDYNKRGVSVDEIIAEGNMGLLNAVRILERDRQSFLKADGRADMERVCDVIDCEIRLAMETMIDEQTENKDWENAIVAKTNLLQEAAKYLAEDLGRGATDEELAEYTRLSVEEIHDIMGLSEDIKKLAR